MPAQVRQRYVAWIAAGRGVRRAHGILAELVSEPSTGQGDTAVTIWLDHDSSTPGSPPPGRDVLTASAVRVIWVADDSSTVMGVEAAVPAVTE